MENLRCKETQSRHQNRLLGCYCGTDGKGSKRIKKYQKLVCGHCTVKDNNSSHYVLSNDNKSQSVIVENVKCKLEKDLF